MFVNQSELKYVLKDTLIVIGQYIAVLGMFVLGISAAIQHITS